MIITEAGADDRVTHLLYVTSVMPDAGQSQADLIGSEPAPWLRPGDDGTVGVDPDMIREFFLQDCDESTTGQALSRLTRQSLTPFTQAPRQSPGGRSPPRTSSAPRISPPRPRRSVDASKRTHDSSSSARDITRFFRVPTSSHKHRRRDRPQLSKPRICLFSRCFLVSRPGQDPEEDQPSGETRHHRAAAMLWDTETKG